jgi:hypothetical protein
MNVPWGDGRDGFAGQAQDPPHIPNQKNSRLWNYEALFAKLWIAAVSLS